MSRKLNGLHFNNILLQGNKVEYVKRPKLKAMSANLSEGNGIIVNVYFQQLDRTPEPTDPNPEAIVSFTGMEFNRTDTVMDVLDYLEAHHPGYPDMVFNVTYTQEENRQEGPYSNPIFIERITITDEDHFIDKDLENNGSASYDEEEEAYIWTGEDWMYALIAGGTVPTWHPEIETPYDPAHPARTNGDDYPEAAVNQVPLADIIQEHQLTQVNLTFGYEKHTFKFTLDEQTTNGVKMMAAHLV
ncbi:hypothetical protein SAMN02745823_02825 [Sporobacter termitidis DSM 10068]|uniref:Uncharacterized protein n=1 Tax=Sporobacter termitidis DSM 10068 TaxID=1123282 RepID=A0A1M5YSZ2_9FIRM|nr:hypothetical protein [Sporobacter termitidis]SHI15125.1 hypothetical protein SAMN02745823_02825 [Sporobacter termitidis DSM 10068]